MEFFSAKYLIWAISAFSLPLGSVVGLQTKLRPIAISVLAAFGAGALIEVLVGHFYVRWPMGEHLTEYMTSIQKEPPIRQGTPEPYVPKK